MNKNIFVAALLLSTVAFAQEKEFKFGLKVLPGIGWSRVEPDSWEDATTKIYTYEANSSQFRGGFGVFGDYYLKDNYAVSIGVNYLFNSSGYNIKSTGGVGSNVDVHSIYSMQYIQAPIMLKFFTNEVVDNLKIYLNLGLAPSLLVGTSVNGKSSSQPAPGLPVKKYTKGVTTAALDFVVGTGVEYELDGGTKLLLGITYMHGLFNVNANSDADYYRNDKSGFTFKNSLLSLELGVKF